MYDAVGMTLFNVLDPHGRLISRGGIRDKDSLILIPAHAVAAEGDILDEKRNDHPFPEGGCFFFNIHDKSSLYNPGDYC